MVISAPVNNSAYVTNTHAEVNKFDSTANNVDQRVNAVVEDGNPQSSLKIAERLSERSEQPAWQQKNQEGELASLQSTKRALTNMENVANQLNEAIDVQDVEDNEKVSQLRAQLKELTAQLNSSQSDESKNKSDSEGDEVKVKFNSSEMSSIAETLAKTDLTGSSQSEIKKLLTGEVGLMNQIATVRNDIENRIQNAYSDDLVVDNDNANEASQASKKRMLDASGAKQLNGTSTSADITVSILG